ncbi:fibrous sheath CABYR-binding protein [Microtus pennsylvanicus]|uniref:fibrous sheath CABYR-binding protein n=1 Tax=Microtus pennsylvanicus TaxID=10058 RepID=UPI003F6C7EAA
MEESDEPEQPISLGSQEFRRRRRASQSMVDKSQQTDAPEKKKPMAVAQPPVPKATLSIGNISGSKDNYSAKEYESLRLSSQLQQTWIKRKQGMEMTDKSLQTEASVEEKAKAILTDKTFTLEETPSGVRETAPELPQCVPEVEIPTSRPTDQLIDRSQQTSCTGDFSVMYICPKETVDKEQQTYFSELEITIMNMPGSSLLKPKEETIPVTQEGSSFEVDGSLELEVLPGEKVPDAMMPFTGGAFSGEIQADELPSEAPGDISHLSVQGALSYEPYDLEYLQKAEVDHEEQPIEIVVPFTDMFVKIQNVAGEEESATAEESTDGGQPLPSEGAFKEVQPPLDKHTLEAVSTEIAVVLVEEFPIEDVFEGGQRPSAEDAPEEVAPARVLPPPAEEAPAGAPPAPAEEASDEAPPAPAEEAPAEAPPAPAEEAPVEDPPAEEAPAEPPPAPAEEAPTEAPPAPAEETPAEAPHASAEEVPVEAPPAPAEEAPVEPSPPPVEEAPVGAPPAPAEEAHAEVPHLSADDTPAEVEFLPTQETPLQGASVEVQPLSAEEVFTNVVPVEDGPTAETGSPSSEGAPPEETTMETQVTSVEESPEKTSADVQPPPPETPAEDSPVVKQPSKTDGVPIQEFPMQDIPDEGSPAPSEDKTLLKEHQLPPVATDSSSLTGDRNSEGTDPTPADVSRSKDEPVSTIKIAGTIKIELKNPPS